MKTEHYITVGEQPYCTWLGCAAGREIASQSGIHNCGFDSHAAARRAARTLGPFFCVPVRAVRGVCPTLQEI